jgi:hypothetical protein
MLWPADWSVRFDPVELITPQGEVFAREGDFLFAGGGLNADGVFEIGPLDNEDKHGFLAKVSRLRELRIAAGLDPDDFRPQDRLPE